MAEKGGPLAAIDASVDLFFDSNSKEIEARRKVTGETAVHIERKKASLDVHSTSDIKQRDTDVDSLCCEELDVKDGTETDKVTAGGRPSLEEKGRARNLEAAGRRLEPAPDSEDAGTEVHPQDGSTEVDGGEGETGLFSQTLPQDANAREQQTKAFEARSCGRRRAENSSLPDTIVAQARALFAELTKDQESVLQIDEVETVLSRIRYTVPRALIEEAFLDYDAEFDGGITESNLIQLVEDVETNAKQKKRLLDIFAILDVDGTGLIDGTFLRTLLCGDPPSGEAVFVGGEAPLNEAEFSHFMVEARATPDGLLDYKRFVNKFLFRNPIEPARKPVKPRGKKKKNKATKT